VDQFRGSLNVSINILWLSEYDISNHLILVINKYVKQEPNSFSSVETREPV
jgi:hypothetical protein